MKRTNYCNGFCGNGGFEFSSNRISSSRIRGNGGSSSRVLEYRALEFVETGVSNTRALEYRALEHSNYRRSNSSVSLRRFIKGSVAGMQLRLIYGRAGAGKTMCCLNSAADLLQDDKSPASIIILVPEQATFDVERRLAAKTEGEAFADAHVVGFRRLGERVLTDTGGLIKPRLTDLGKKMALRRLLLAHEKDLKILSRAAKQRTFTDTLTSAIWEFKTWCITPAMLEKVGQDTAEGALKDKVADLA